MPACLPMDRQDLVKHTRWWVVQWVTERCFLERLVNLLFIYCCFGSKWVMLVCDVAMKICCVVVTKATIYNTKVILSHMFWTFQDDVGLIPRICQVCILVCVVLCTCCYVVIMLWSKYLLYIRLVAWDLHAQICMQYVDQIYKHFTIIPIKSFLALLFYY